MNAPLALGGVVWAAIGFGAGLVAKHVFDRVMRYRALSFALASDALGTIRLMSTTLKDLTKDQETLKKTPMRNAATLRSLCAGYVVTPPLDKLHDLFEFLGPAESGFLVGYLDDYAQFTEREARYRAALALLREHYSGRKLAVEMHEDVWDQIIAEIDHLVVRSHWLNAHASSLFAHAHKVTLFWCGPTVRRLSNDKWNTLDDMQRMIREAHEEAAAQEAAVRRNPDPDVQP